jgi:large subunit ribosomal protein L19
MAVGYTKETILQDPAGDTGFPKFKAGDTIQVAQRIKEGNKERTQYLEGDVIAIRNNGISSTFTIRRIGANGIAVERIIPYYSKRIVDIKFIREGDVRRAKLYYMRDRIGKKARVPEKVRTKAQKQRKKNASASA